MMSMFKNELSSVVLLILISISLIRSENTAEQEGQVLSQQDQPFQCESEGFFHDPNDCSIFYHCILYRESLDNSVHSKFTLFKFQCRSGAVYDIKSNSCILAHLSSVPKCRPGYSEPMSIGFSKAGAKYEVNNLDYGVLQQEQQYQLPGKQPSHIKPETDAPIEPMNEVDNTINEPPPRVTRSPYCNREGFFGIEGDCSHFYRCVSSGIGFMKYEFSCGERTVWDPDNNACNHVWAVTRSDCKVDQLGSSGKPEEGSEYNPHTDANQSQQGGYPRPDSYPIQSSYPIQGAYLGRGSGSKYPNQEVYPTQGSDGSAYPDQGGYSNQIGGNGYPHQGGYPTHGSASGYPSQGYPIQGSSSGYLGQSTGKPAEVGWYPNPTSSTVEPQQNSLSSQSPFSYPPFSSFQPTENSSISTTLFNTSTQPNHLIGNHSITTSNGTCSLEGFQGVSGNCRKFIRCVSNGKGFTKYEFECAEGTVWDTEILTCNYPNVVQRSDCKNEIGNKVVLVTREPNNSNINSGTSNNQRPATNYPSGNEDNQQTSSTTSQNSNETSTPNQPLTSSQIISSEQQTIMPDQETSPNSGENLISILTGNNTDVNESSLVPNKVDQCMEEGFFPSSTNCKKFYRCVKNKGKGFSKYEFNCGPGTIYDPDNNVCNHPSAVQNNQCIGGGASQSSTSIVPEEATQPSTNSSTPIRSTTIFTSSKPNKVITTTVKPSSSITITTKPNTVSKPQNVTTIKPSHSITTPYSPNKNTTPILKPNGITTKPNTVSKPQNVTTIKPSHSIITPLRPTKNTTITVKPNSTTTKPNNVFKPQNVTTIKPGLSTTTPLSPSKNTTQKVKPNGITTKPNIVSKPQNATIKPAQSSTTPPRPSKNTTQTVKPNGITTKPNIVSKPQNATIKPAQSSTTPPRPSKNTTQTVKPNGITTKPNIVSKPQDVTTIKPGLSTTTPLSPSKNTTQKVKPNGITTKPNTLSKPQNATIKPAQSSTTPPRPSKNTTTTLKPSSITTTTKPNTAFKPQNVTTIKPDKGTTTPIILQRPSKTTTTTVKFTTPTTKLPSSSSSSSSSLPSTKKPSASNSKPLSATSKSTKSPINTESTTVSQNATKPENPTSVNTATELTTNNTDCDNKNSSKPAVTMKVNCTKAGFYPYPGNCKKFYRCADWDGDKGKRFSVYYFDCPEGTIFDPNLETCNHAESVYPTRDCNASASSSSELSTKVPSTNSTTPEESTNTTPNENEVTNLTEESTEPTTTSPESSTTDSNVTTTLLSDTTTSQSDTTTSQSDTTTSPSDTTTSLSDTTTLLSDTTTSLSDTTTSLPDTTTSLPDTTTSLPDTTMISPSEMTTQPSSSSTGMDTGTTESLESTTNTLLSTQSLESTTEVNQVTTLNPEESITELIQGSDNKTCPELKLDQFAVICPTGFRRHPKFCNLFYQCTTSQSNEIKVLTLSCSNGTIYDEDKIQCLPPNQAQKCDGMTSETKNMREITDSSIPLISIKSEKPICPNEGQFSYKENCRLFYKCKKHDKGKLDAFIYQCPEGYVYWNISKRCEKQEKVPCDSGQKVSGKFTLVPVENRNIGHK